MLRRRAFSAPAHIRNRRAKRSGIEEARERCSERENEEKRERERAEGVSEIERHSAYVHIIHIYKTYASVRGFTAGEERRNGNGNQSI